MLLAACTRSEPPIGAPGAISQSPTTVISGDRGGSWMLSRAPQWDLLYVSNGNGTVTVYRYWKHDLVGKLSGFRAPMGECVDEVGDVYITDSDASKIFEFAHGGKTPLRVLSDPRRNAPYGCSIDPTTGDLAVANLDYDGRGDIAIYRRASGKPRIYSTLCCVYFPLACTYNNRGDLFVAGFVSNTASRYSSFAELDKHGRSFIPVNPFLSSSWNWVYVTGIPWDGKYFVIGEDGAYRFKVKGDGQAIYKGITGLNGIFNEEQSWIYHFTGSNSAGLQLVAASGSGTGSVVYWNYPSGGDSIATITDGVYYPYGVTVSPKEVDISPRR
ncbi:MAG: hypothetical protein JO113_02790 [Candidatus Eremiobacteraeota bacterium]|nr:hypothetical protein [Candidatus Eremiobacteraeota bacterium]